MPRHPILDRRLLFVSGKGGVGKTVTSAAIAQFAFQRHKRVLVVELSPYGRIRELLGGPHPGRHPKEILPNLEIVRIDPREALEEFLEGLLRFRMLVQRLLESSSFTIFTAAAPGIEEFLVLSRIVELEKARSGLRLRPRWDLIVVDAPASGHSVPFLATARHIRDMVPVGPIRRMADDVVAVLSDASKTAALLVTIPEEMAVNETFETLASLRRERPVATGPVVVNAVWPDRFSRADSERLLAEAPRRHPLLDAGRYHVRKRKRAEAELSRVRATLEEAPIVFPFVLDPETERPRLGPLVAALEEAACAG